ncbi:hypothetical protein OTU49_004038 [Cherax quadricarinatus]|uniref:Secreted protein n=1 Tax=Cherax quadricarinatus TaxID=27406 RepID=A0AAW0X142_CHEQU
MAHFFPLLSLSFCYYILFHTTHSSYVIHTSSSKHKARALRNHLCKKYKETFTFLIHALISYHVYSPSSPHVIPSPGHDVCFPVNSDAMRTSVQTQAPRRPRHAEALSKTNCKASSCISRLASNSKRSYRLIRKM